MQVLKVWNDNPSEKQLLEAKEWIESGEVIICPTDTLYAFVCNALDPKAIERLCSLKGINPVKTNLSIICSDIAQASHYARIDNKVYSLMKSNTPGAFTFLCRAANSLPRAFKGRKVVGVRIPNSNICRSLSEIMECPLLTTSIECEEMDYNVNPELLSELYSHQINYMIDGGEGGVEPSTIVDCTEGEAEIIRQGKGELNI